jgi:hypothetical protein
VIRGAVGDLATRLAGQPGLAEPTTERLRAIAANGGDLQMFGDYAPRYLDAPHDLPADAMKERGLRYRSPMIVSGGGEGLTPHCPALTARRAPARTGTAPLWCST